MPTASIMTTATMIQSSNVSPLFFILYAPYFDKARCAAQSSLLMSLKIEPRLSGQYGNITLGRYVDDLIDTPI